MKLPIFVLITIVTSLTQAKCREWPLNYKNLYINSEVVVLGTIIEVKVDTSPNQKMKNRQFIAKYEVKEYFKKADSDTKIVKYNFGYSTSYPLIPGVSYIFFLSESRESSFCNGTTAIQSHPSNQSDEEKLLLTKLGKFRDSDI